MNKHENLIRQIAEEMATEYNEFADSINVDDSVTIEHCKIYARIAVKHMANTFSVGYGEGAKWGMSFYANGRMRAMMTDRGLIPEAGKEAAGDES